METYKDIELYTSSDFNELDKVTGEYTIEIENGKARIKPQDLFGQLAKQKSRLSTLHSIGGVYTGDSNQRYYMLRANYKDYYFKITKLDPFMLLQKYGFKATAPYELRKGRYIAVVWQDKLTVNMSYHTPNTGRFLHSTTYYNPLLLKKELEKNHE